MKQSAYQYALYLLSAQDYSEFKLRQKLRLKQFEQTEIDETLTKLIEKNYLREEEYKRLLARRWIAKGYSDSMIKRRGEQEQLTFTAEELLSWRQDMDRSSDDTISLLVQKKMRGRDLPVDREGKQKLREKVSRFLLSKGYGWEDVRRAVDEAMRAN
jgi:regulatory protein